MLAACAARLPEASAGPLVWVDLGGGTAENVASMAKYVDLARFSVSSAIDASLIDRSVELQGNEIP